MLSRDRGEFPEASVPGLTYAGSFDSVTASLRETATPLRMTDYLECLRVCDSNVALVGLGAGVTVFPRHRCVPPRKIPAQAELGRGTRA
jgi:hypothetical protein